MSFTITSHPQQLISAIRNDIPVSFQEEEWESQPKARCDFLNRIFSIFCSCQDDSVSKVASHMLSRFDAIEKIPVPLKSRLVEHHRLASYFRVADALIDKLSNIATERAQNHCTKLKQRVLSLKYRMGLEHGGLNKNIEIDSQTYNALKFQLGRYKASHICFDNEEVTYDDQKALYELCTYGEFAKLVLWNPKIGESFFKWTFRDKNPVNIFVEYSALSEMLETAFLSKCVSRLGHCALKLQYQPSEGSDQAQKVVTLPFEGKEINILNQDEIVHFKKGNWSVRIHDIFSELAKQNTQMPRFTFFPKMGIINWKADSYSYWDDTRNEECRIDLSTPTWYEQLPKMEITREEAQERYKDSLNQNQAVVALCATRSNESLDADGAHGYTEIALPSKSNTYFLYSFGKFARPEDWPSERNKVARTISLLSFAAKTVPAVMPYPDANIHYTHRQFGRLSFVFDPKITHVAENYLSTYRTDIAKSLQGNLTFQLGAESCAKSVQEKAEANLKGIVEVPKVFGPIRIEDNVSPLQSFARWVLAGKKNRSEYIKKMQQYFRVLAPGRGIYVLENGKKVWKSLDTSKFWSNWMVYNPTNIYPGQESGALPYVVHVK